jgi:hypothetical protein
LPSGFRLVGLGFNMTGPLNITKWMHSQVKKFTYLGFGVPTHPIKTLQIIFLGPFLHHLFAIFLLETREFFVNLQTEVKSFS